MNNINTLQEIEHAVSQLSPDELAAFRIWFAQFDAAVWDRQFEEDVAAGNLDGGVSNVWITAFKLLTDDLSRRLTHISGTSPENESVRTEFSLFFIENLNSCLLLKPFIFC